MTWIPIRGTEGRYEYNRDTDTVRNARTGHILKSKMKKGTEVYRFKINGHEKMFTAESVRKLRTTDAGLHRKCLVCGKEFVPYTTRSKYCSKKCKNKDTDKTEIWNKGRCKKYEVPFTPGVTKQAVIEKFDGKCCLCGKQTDRDGDIKDWPTIDHIVPLSCGGGHEWSNVQLLCFSCNSSKGRKIDDDQFQAFIEGLLNAH